jgi:hypothetical protein
MEKIYIGQCNCLHTSDITSDACRKRFVVFKDFITGDQKQIGICNEWYRIEYQNTQHNTKFILRDFFEDYYKIKTPCYNLWGTLKGNSFKNYPIRVVFTDQSLGARGYPYLSGNVFSFEEIINLFIEKRTRQLRKLVVENMIGFLNQLTNKTSKSKYKKLLSEVSQIDKWKYFKLNEDEQDQYLMNFIMSTHEININFLNKKNKT